MESGSDRGRWWRSNWIEIAFELSGHLFISRSASDDQEQMKSSETTDGNGQENNEYHQRQTDDRRNIAETRPTLDLIVNTKR